jgi:CRP-like cAMP-binding protein
MANSNLMLAKPEGLTLQSFKRREYLSSQRNHLWRIESGAVRTYTLTDDGMVIVLGFWSEGDVIGQSLTRIQPYEMECLTDVQAQSLHLSECDQLDQILFSHLHQAQELLRVRSGQIYHRFCQLLDWLAEKFGHESEQGHLIKLRLTHQDIADTLGTTRVTVTRLLGQFEREGRIGWVGQQLLLVRDS